MGTSVRLLPWFAGAMVVVGPSLALMGCGGGGGGRSGGGTTGPGATPGTGVGLAVVPEEGPVVAAPQSSTTGSQFQLGIDSYDTAGVARDVTRQATFSSSDDTVARVGADGLVEAVKAGTVTITANYGGMSVTKDVEVVAAVASPTFASMKVYPAARALADISATASNTQEQQIIVVGIDAAGKAHDLTRTIGVQLLDWDANATTQLPPTTAASISPTGLLTGRVAGEDVLVQAVLTATSQNASALIHLGPGQVKAPPNGGVFSPGGLAGSTSALDQAVVAALQAKGVAAAPAASDGEFIRRLYSDALGRLPTQAEAETFLASSAADKRSTEIDKALAMPEFATHWGSRLGEWFTINDVTFDTWAEQQIATRTLPQIIGDLATGTGQGGTLFDARHTDGSMKVNILVMVATGMMAECAGCHVSPNTGPNDNPKWDQGDKYRLDAFFVATANEAIPLDKTAARTGNGGQPFQPGFQTFDATKTVTSTLTTPLATRRQEFATLFTATSQFRRGLAHRIWSDIAQPLLDPNQFNYANLSAVQIPGVLTALAAEFERTGGDLKGYLAAIMKTKTYQLGSTVSSLANDPLLVRRILRRQQTEGCQSLVLNMTGAMPTTPGFFQQTFGFPLDRARIDERSTIVNMSQSLVLQNSPTVQAGLTAANSVTGQLATDVGAGTISIDQAITRLWLRAYSRTPSADELTDAKATVTAAGGTRAGLDDVAVALMASIEAAAN